MAELGIAASIIAVIQMTGTVTQYLASVKGASKDSQNILNELSNVTGMLFVLKDQADEAEHDDSWNTTLRTLDMPNGPLEQFKAALETLAAKLAPVDGMKKFRKSLKWPFEEKEIKDILNRIERQKALFNLARQNDHLTLTKALKNDLMSIQDSVDDIGKNMARFQISDYQDKVIKWLSAPDPSLNYKNALKARHVKTGTWLIESEVFLRWTLNAGSLLWLYGIPGCGKTILSSTIIQYLLDHCHQRPRSAVLYFYFDFNESEKQLHENMIRSLITQLFVCQKSTSDSLDSLYKIGRQPTNEDLLDTLHVMITASNEVFIILDALDECTERPELLSDIEEIMRWQDIHLHVLVTSRREVDIEESLEPLCDEETRICIPSALVDADIRTYVHDRLSEDRRFKRWRDHTKVQQEIEDTLMEKAGGMFRWAVCQLDTLGCCVTRPQLRKALHSLPKDLDGTYERILCNIDDSNVAYALKILQWLTFSARPLSLEEIAEVVAIDVHDDPRFDPEKRLAAPRDVMSICSSLITIDGEEIMDYRLKTQYTPVRLAHFSVKEYLVSDRVRIGKASGYSIRERESIAVIVEDCLAYLLYFDVADVFTLQKVDEPTNPAVRSEYLTPERRSEFPLALYAAQYWTLHAQTAERNGTTETCSLTLELLCSADAAFNNWVHLCDFNNLSFTSALDIGSRLESQGLLEFLRSPLHYVSLIGLANTVRLFIKQKYNVNAKLKTRSGEISALCAACMGGDPSVVEILLDNGAVINSNNSNEIGAPLYQASYFGHEEVVRLLLDSGADANAQGGEHLTALHAAFSRRNANIAKLLLDHDADINVQGEDHQSALYAATYMGSIEIVQRLVDKGADVNAQGGRFGNALQAASTSGLIDIVQLLIKKGADVNTQGGYYENALHAASSICRKDIVQLLVEKGVDVSAQGGPALQAASYYGSMETVQLLIEKGADVNDQGGEYGNVLQAASSGGEKEVVQLLIEKGADVNAQGGKYGNALQAMSYWGYKEIVQLLIKKGADVNARGGRYGNALQAASYGGEKEVAQLLIEKGARVNAQGSRYGNALQTASYKGRKEVVQLLVEKGADIHAQGGRYGNALQAASYGGEKEVVQLLIEKGADVHAQGGRYHGNALQAASDGGRKEVVQLLIEKGADVNARVGDYRTALQAAITMDNSDIVQLLRDNGAVELGDTSESEAESDVNTTQGEKDSDGSEHQSKDDRDEIGHQSEKDSDGIEQQSEEAPEALQQDDPT